MMRDAETFKERTLTLPGLVHSATDTDKHRWTVDTLSKCWLAAAICIAQVGVVSHMHTTHTHTCTRCTKAGTHP